MNTALVPGSLGDLARQSGASLAETFLSADIVILIDVSGSMVMTDARGGQRRYDVACEELAQLQRELPGKVAVVAFSSEALFVPSGQPPLLEMGTDLAGALTFIQPADGVVRFVVISDGYPDNPEGALAIARRMTSRIDCIFVGPETDMIGREFLDRLARARGGASQLAEKANELARTVKQMLLTGGT